MTKDIFDILESLSIHYERIDHPAVYTSEEARQLVPHRPARAAKNLFLRDKKGKRHILLVVDDQKSVRFKDVERQTGLTHLSMGSPERLERCLGVTAGAVSLLALINDSEGKVEVLIDRELWEGEEIQAHPLVNTATVVMAIADMAKFIEHSGHSIQFVDVA
jgi:Ala-tRNA(Pro) deacylase